MRKKKKKNIDSKLPTVQRRKQRFRESRQLNFRYMACEQRTKVIDTFSHVWFNVLSNSLLVKLIYT